MLMSKEDINESRTFWYNLAKKLFIKLAISSLVSMLFSSIYMMAYGMFVEKIKWNSNKNSIFY